MRYRINEIFYSIQGEGRFTGVPTVFVRFSGCNIKCPFCDTDFKTYKEMSEEDIIAEVKRVGGNSTHVVFTGGEPTLQLTESLCDKLHAIGKYLAIETNGTNEVPNGVDFITCSPKFEYCKRADLKVVSIDELKVVYNSKNDMSRYDNIRATYKYLQPCDLQDANKNAEIINATVKYIKAHPEWRISLQTQKILAVR